jgi:monoamine oxidase
MLDFILDTSVGAESQELESAFSPSSSNIPNKIPQIHNTIIFNSQVIEINQNEFNKEGEKICIVLTQNSLTGQKDKFICKKIVSSIPINQYSRIKFEPELPMYKRNVFNNLHFGNATKFLITYEKAFWKEKGFSGEVISDGSIMHLQEHGFNEFYERESERLNFNKQMPTIGPIICMFDATSNENEPALVGFLGGRSSVEWADVDTNIRKREIIESVVRYFGDEARDYIDYTGE